MYVIIHDRVFWIYFIITLFFIILGIRFILLSSDPFMYLLSFFWLLSNFLLILIIYSSSSIWAPINPHNDTQICVIDHNSNCFEPNNRIWLFINILFIIILIFSTLWASELGNDDGSHLKTMSGVLILIGSILLSNLLSFRNSSSTHFLTYTPFWISVIYILLWLGLTLYVVLL